MVWSEKLKPLWQWWHSARSPKNSSMPRVSAGSRVALPARKRSYRLSPDTIVRWKLAIALTMLAQVTGVRCPGNAAVKRFAYPARRSRARISPLFRSVTPISTGRSPNRGTSACRSRVTSDGLAHVSVM